MVFRARESCKSESIDQVLIDHSRAIAERRSDLEYHPDGLHAQLGVHRLHPRHYEVGTVGTVSSAWWNGA